ncbi:hypothetical protein [Nonomuraea sp. NPDC048901]|uniref:hypothetical protein n=1 Tax=Nonomuraea sp. NPDC048901 TaxID=3155627 RepID=UPI0033F8358E
MGLRGALTVLAEQWDDIHDRLSAQEFAKLSSLVDEFVREGDRAIAEEIAEDLADRLRKQLPHDHPFVEALSGPVERWAPTPARRAKDLAAWLRLADPLRARLVGGPVTTADEVDRAAVSELLAAPALRADELTANGQDPEDPGLIRLEDADGSPCWPAFQFAGDGSPLPIVLSINQILEAADDPFGAAGWWLGDNGRLGGAPARLIGRLPDERLLAAARAETREA